MTYKFLMTAPALGAAGRKVLADAGCEVDYLQNANDEKEVEQLMETRAYDAVISRTVNLTAKAIASCPSLKIICKHGVGVTNIDVAAATERAIPVLTTPATNAQSVAELTVGLMLSAARQLPFFQQEIAEGRWTRSSQGIELSGKTLGLVGYGEIGRRVAHIAKAIGMRTAFFDPAIAPGTDTSDAIQYSSLQELLKNSNVLSLHCPVNKATRLMLNADTLAQLPDSAIVINTSRGELIDEPALVQALTEGKIAAAGLDTVAVEPLPLDHPFRQFSNIVMTPHIGGTTPEALDAVSRSAAQQCLDFLQQNRINIRACVNPESLKKGE
ncbi:hydroxyacid dehydrogenase [Rouxiella badensis]|jgi:D-3-phosphoglycerate dehydrogenase|uniref:Hydroxyacid dehydrogenase n=1 Tax=Rouxiella badensis TaxID=1646377 RepID=A0A1X0WAA9_9GAMM|nr:hydroxyacid dehydrogenase [Rouxiella badensis]MCC3720797.1 hydroxyacid dehydrogenase [Rouxiella badensis]MCC3730636.1 hydroxyacid dehydrogenase [Rouxiella badensis]MCC3734869.1 hydroxyacid dehydrogenase [Rouxiella badensis]MCC3741866.1 hydroxyacid dehydrogenase [Rouxiella badensis]MCC3760272.1 hydroxyacid dehydrogenase [Rouxiella badensis]